MRTMLQDRFWPAAGPGGDLRLERHFDSRAFRCFSERPATVDALFRASVARRSGVGFHQDVSQMKLRSEPVLDDRWVPFASIGARESTGSLENIDRSSKPTLGEQRGRNPTLRRVRGLDAFRGGAGIIELRDPAGIAAGEPHPLSDS